MQTNQQLKELDQQNRRRALRCDRSFIVEAPAGSGKTTLLTQRFLALLAQVAQKPEEILAITFTNKAAYEMRSRIMSALDKAASKKSPTSDHEKTTWELAHAVLEKDQKLNWQLLTNSNRLRIQTIDAFCYSVVSRAPQNEFFSNNLNNIADSSSVSACYSQAVHNLFTEWQGDPNTKPNQAFKNLLLYLDNDLNRIEKLLVNMLARRDHWLDYAVAGKVKTEDDTSQNQLRQHLEENLYHISYDVLEKLLVAAPSKSLLDELLELAKFAANNLNIPDVCNFSPQDVLDLNSNALIFWKLVGKIFLTQKLTLKKRLDKKSGFPSGGDKLEKKMKQRATALVEDLTNYPEFIDALVTFNQTPPTKYSDQQWEILNNLFTILPLLVAHLKIVFQNQRLTDYTEVALAANNALDTQEFASDVLLNLDYTLQHILIDEFQDTSVTQYKLLQRLTAGWEEQDGRTIFIVGDPMQSIYRFREAEVGLFLRAKQEGINDIKLDPIELKLNFRSKPSLVNWFNQLFTSISVKHDDINLGQVAFKNAATCKEPDAKQSAQNCVILHPLADADTQTEAAQIVSIIKERQQIAPQKDIAILVRARDHLAEIIPALKDAKLEFTAIEAEKLIQQMSVQDLLSLTKALTNFADRASWLSILRAPWCGLMLSDLHTLCHDQPNRAIWDLLNSSEQFKKLSSDGQKRCKNLISIINQSLTIQDQQSPSKWIKHTWLALGGPASLNFASEIKYVDNFFNLLSQYTQNGHLNLNLLETALDRIYINTSTNPNSNIQIMTIHKAKGLEFSSVIIPGLSKTSRRQDAQLLLWQERIRHAGNQDLILAPLPSVTSSETSLYKYLNKVESTKASFELQRLLYVAVTRAKESLHLVTTITTDEEGAKTAPPRESFLWHLNSIFEGVPQIEIATSQQKLETQTSNNLLKRFASDWQNPINVFQELAPQIANATTELNARDNSSNIIGSVIHAILERLSQEPLPDLSYIDKFITENQPLWKALLFEHGISKSALTTGLKTVTTAIKNTLFDQRGRWILKHDHKNTHSEYAITYASGKKDLQQLIIDRTFIDDDILWIIDYKTGSSENFAEHWPQLERYAEALESLVPNKNIKLGIYFPLDKSWHVK